MAQMFYLASPPATEYWVYVGGTHGSAHGAVYCLKMDATTGALTGQPSNRPVATLPGGGPWFALSPAGQSLYVSVRGGEGPENNYCAAFAIDRRSGHLGSLGTASTVLPGSAHCSVSPDGRTLVASMMSGGGVASFELAPTGAFEGAAQSVISLSGGGSFVRMTRVRR
jgi:6-phosphogluconolactonase (cycloisomerase 2 family)